MNDPLLQKVLNTIASAVAVDPRDVFVENGTVFYHEADGSLCCACSVNTAYWNELLAQVMTAELMRRLTCAD